MAFVATFFVAQGIQFGFLSTWDGMSMPASFSFYFVMFTSSELCLSVRLSYVFVDTGIQVCLHSQSYPKIQNEL